MFGINFSKFFSNRSAPFSKEIKTNFTLDCVRQVNHPTDKKWIKTLKAKWREHLKEIKPYPGYFEGKGIVVCAGGIKYFTSAWINISMLRKLGCTLPIEVWYNGNELNGETIAALEGLGAKCKNCRDYSKSDLAGYALKPFSILYSEFKEVLYLDADNNCLRDPSYLFDSEEYKQYGAVFWPDFWTTDKVNPIWEVIGSNDYDSIEQESGQILVDKEQCWKELNLCMYFNFNREDYYKLLLGDKDTYKFAWKALHTEYYMVPTSVGLCGTDDPSDGFCGITMVQHDLKGDIIFLHRNWFKWDIMNDDEVMWTTIKRYKPGGAKKTFSWKLITKEGAKFRFLDIGGEVVLTSFTEPFGDYELQCLEILGNLRNDALYGRLLQHAYFSFFRPGYVNGYTKNFFSVSETHALSDY